MKSHGTYLLFTIALSLYSSLTLAAHAVVTATSKEEVKYYWAHSVSSPQKAEWVAMYKCLVDMHKGGNKGDCRLEGADNGPMFISFFNTIDGLGFGVAVHPDRQEAIDNAYGHCIANGRECPNTAQLVIFDEGQLISRRHPFKFANENQVYESMLSLLELKESNEMAFELFEKMGGDTKYIHRYPHYKNSTYGAAMAAQTLAKAIMQQHRHLIDVYFQVSFGYENGHNVNRLEQCYLMNPKRHAFYERNSYLDCSFP